MSDFDDVFEKALHVCTTMGAILGATGGFLNGGLGGAILGVILGGIGGLLLCLFGMMVWIVASNPVFWIITGLIMGLALVCFLISTLWGVGKP